MPVVLPYLETTAAGGSEVRAFVQEALETARPPLDEAERLLASQDEAMQLRKAWDEVGGRLLLLGRDLGAWAIDRGARMLVQDLGRGTRQLRAWYEGDDAESDSGDGRGTKGTVGGSAAHAQLLRDAKQRLQARLDSRPPARPRADSGSESGPSKLQALINHLRERQPRKCLIFVQRRVSSKLLAEALQSELEESSWSVDWVCSAGSVGVCVGRGSDKLSEPEVNRRLDSFRGGLRVLVSTAILEEGIDVPECDAVVDFDGATTSRQFQQRGGRARAAKNASYAHLLCTNSTDSNGYDEQGYRNMLGWNEMTVRLLAHAPDRQPPPPRPAAQARAIPGPIPKSKAYHP